MLSIAQVCKICDIVELFNIFPTDSWVRIWCLTTQIVLDHSAFRSYPFCSEWFHYCIMPLSHMYSIWVLRSIPMEDKLWVKGHFLWSTCQIYNYVSCVYIHRPLFLVFQSKWLFHMTYETTNSTASIKNYYCIRCRSFYGFDTEFSTVRVVYLFEQVQYSTVMLCTVPKPTQYIPARIPSFPRGKVTLQTTSLWLSQYTLLRWPDILTSR